MKFLLYSRPACGLCEEMYAQLAVLAEHHGVPIEVVDVDDDPQTRERYGHKIPLLMLCGELVCHGHLDAEEVHKALAYHRRPV